MIKIIRIASTSLLMFAAVAGAQAPAPATDLPPLSLPKVTCVKPGDAPGRNGGDMQRKNWQRDATAWQDCMRKYIDGLKTQSDFYTKAANDAVDEFNKATTTWNEQLKAAKE